MIDEYGWQGESNQCSSARRIIREHEYPFGLSSSDNLVDCAIEMSKNGELAETATGAAVLGHPAQSVAMLANLLSRRGDELPAGALILTGGASAAIAVQAGDRIDLTIQGLGALSVTFT